MIAYSHRLGLASLAVAATFGACSTSTADRKACYAKAEAAAAARADAECPVGDGGVNPSAWEDCRAREAIMIELAAAMKGCK